MAVSEQTIQCGSCNTQWKIRSHSYPYDTLEQSVYCPSCLSFLTEVSGNKCAEDTRLEAVA